MWTCSRPLILPLPMRGIGGVIACIYRPPALSQPNFDGTPKYCTDPNASRFVSLYKFPYSLVSSCCLLRPPGLGRFCLGITHTLAQRFPPLDEGVLRCAHQQHLDNRLSTMLQHCSMSVLSVIWSTACTVGVRILGTLCWRCPQNYGPGHVYYYGTSQLRSSATSCLSL